MLSIILLSYFSENRLGAAVAKLVETMEQENINFEIIIVDDGSKDASHPIAKSLAAADKRIKAIRLSKNCTSPYAFLPGCRSVRAVAPLRSRRFATPPGTFGPAVPGVGKRAKIGRPVPAEPR